MNISAYLLTFTEGILTFISPCILPMLPIYFLYLAGTADSNSIQGTAESNSIQGTPESNSIQGTADLKECSELRVSNNQRKNNPFSDKSQLVINSVAFVVGFTIVFVAMGATVTSLGHFLNEHKELLRKLSGIVMILFGLNFIGILRIGFLKATWKIDLNFKRLNFGSSVLFGIVFGLGWTPCLGAFLGSALALASTSDTLFQGTLLLFVYSIGLGIPFIITSIAFEKVKEAIKSIQKYSRVINIVSGVLLIIAGVVVYTDTLKYLNYL